MRNPVGPLPSSIYWRRRAIALCLLALVAAIVLWAVNSRGGGQGQGSGAPTGSHSPVATITAGPDPTGTHIGGQPGGRDTPPAGDAPSSGSANGGGSGDTPGTTAGSDGTTAGGGSGGGTGGSTDGGSTGAQNGGDTGGSSGGAQLPAGSALPDCAPSTVQLSLSSVQNAYSPEDTPTFQLRATNSGGTSCKMDFGPAKAVFGITKAADNSHVWASDDCPTSGSYLLQVPAHSSTTFTLRWNGKTSSPQCAKPKGQQAPVGTYLVQAALPGYGSKQVSFVLSAD